MPLTLGHDGTSHCKTESCLCRRQGFLCAGFEIQKKRLGIGPDTAVSVRMLSVLIKHQH